MEHAASISAQELDSVCQRFDADWKAGSRPQIDDYLATVAEPLRSDLFRDLLGRELALRRAAKEQPLLGDYSGRYPKYLAIINELFPTKVVGESGASTENLGQDKAAASPPRIVPDDQLGDYRLVREIGRGGMGVVYEAIDTRSGIRVALKTFSPERARSISAFRNEFRSLAGITHRNLVALGVLDTLDKQPFFTMELIEGCNFLDYVRAGYDSAADADRSNADPIRLFNAMRQLAEGLQALHEAGKLHRDLKPANVLVGRDDRVVILDFGLAVELCEGEYQSQVIAGTPSYMSPEQRTGQAITVASDWYSLGVMLFEAIEGQRPHAPMPGSKFDDVSSSPTFTEPIPPGSTGDLTALCHELLQADPAARPNGPEIVRRLSGEQVESGPASVWVGRDAEMLALDRAADEVRGGQPLVVFLRGSSGIGKTSLCNRFLDRLKSRGSVAILRGRCFERESVPYNAFDGVVEALYQLMRHMPTDKVQRLLPLKVSDLCRVFPTLSEIPAIRDAVPASKPSLDVQEMRHQAFAALREVFSRLIQFDRVLLVLFIDDLQWADRDSAELFLNLMRLPDAPPLLLVAAFRSEEALQSDCLRAIRKSESPDGSLREFAEQRELQIGSLSVQEAKELAVALLSSQTTEAALRAQAIAQESDGSPLFVKILSQSAVASREQRAAAAPPCRLTLSEVLWGEICRLPERERAIVEVIAVAGRPIPWSVARDAAGLTESDIFLYRQLRNRRFIRAVGADQAEEFIEAYHDRERETVLSHISAHQLQRRCSTLAGLLEGQPCADAEWLADLHARANHGAIAGKYFTDAADKAYETLAFEKAVHLYGRALELVPPSPTTDVALRRRLADALSHTGRSAAAARELLHAAASTTGDAAVDLRCRAAMRYLTSGHIDEGLDVLEGSLRATGIKTYSRQWQVIASLLWHRCRLSLTSFNRPIGAGETANGRRSLLDLFWSAGAGLSVIDPIRAADFVSRNLLLALKVGDPHYLVRALAAQTCHIAIPGNRSARRVAVYLRRTRRVAKADGHPYGRACLEIARGVSAHLHGRWQAAVRSCDRAVDHLTDSACRDVGWELDTARTFGMWSLMYMGEVTEMTRRQPQLLRIARENDDLFAVLNFGTIVMSHVLLGADKVSEARQLLQEDRERLSNRGFFVQHHNWLLAKAFVEMYAENPLEAWRGIADGWPGYKKSMLGLVQQVRIDFLQVYCRAAIAAAAAAPPAEAEKYLRIAQSVVRKLRRERTEWATALAGALDAGVHCLRGDLAATRARLADAANRLGKVDMRLFAAAARRHLAILDQQPDALDAADLEMRKLGVANPCRMAASLIPGIRRQ